MRVAVDIIAVEYFKERFGEKYKDHLESMSIDGDGRIIDIGKKFPLINEVDGQYVGFMKFT